MKSVEVSKNRDQEIIAKSIVKVIDLMTEIQTWRQPNGPATSVLKILFVNSKVQPYYIHVQQSGAV